MGIGISGDSNYNIKKYAKEIIVIVLLLVVFYIMPLFQRSGEQPIGEILFSLVCVTILSFIIGCISIEKIKYIYPLVSAIFFLPSVFIYYNSSALIFVLFIIVSSAIGLLVGMFLRWLIKK